MPFRASREGKAVEDVLLSGRPLTVLEAILSVGYSDLARKVARLRARGIPLESREVPLADVLARYEARWGRPIPIGEWLQARLLAGHQPVMTEYYLPGKTPPRSSPAAARLLEGARTARRSPPQAFTSPGGT